MSIDEGPLLVRPRYVGTVAATHLPFFHSHWPSVLELHLAAAPMPLIAPYHGSLKKGSRLRRSDSRCV